VEFRGLEDGKYSLYDYVNGVSFGTVPGNKARLQVEFAGHSLLEVRPE